MTQEMNRMRYLLIGISLLSILTSCEEDDGGDNIQQAEYFYFNKTNNTIRFEIYDSFKGSSIEYNLQPDEHITFLINREFEAYPFSENETEGRTGDSVVIRFQDNRCAIYTTNTDNGKTEGNGVFDLELYENYSPELIKNAPYRLEYFINDKDYNNAVNCE